MAARCRLPAASVPTVDEAGLSVDAGLKVAKVSKVAGGLGCAQWRYLTGSPSSSVSSAPAAASSEGPQAEPVADDRVELGGELGGGPRRRLLMVDDEPAFELSRYCGTCPLLFRRLETAREKLSLESMQERLTGTLDDPGDAGVIDAFGTLLPEGEHLPLLLEVEPRLVISGREGDYCSGEQVTTWGIDQFWGLPGL